MYDISHLLEKHRKEMADLQNEQKQNQRRRDQKMEELNRLADEALRLNTEKSKSELDRFAI